MSLVVKDILKMAQTQLEGSGIKDAKPDAELIFRHALSVDKMGFFKMWGATLDDNACDRYLDLIAVRATGMPLQYITGEQEFMGLVFRVNPETLIPRQDTETVVESVIELLKEKKKSNTVLDLGCGSGNIGISIAKLCTNVKVTMSDISRGALETARKNASLLGVEKISFVEGDLFEPFKGYIKPERFDVIVSNPPYIRSGDLPELQTEVKDYEPMIALDGGSDGLAYYRKIISKAPLHMKENSILVLEIGHDQAVAVAQIADECEKFSDLKVVKDLTGNDRVVILWV